MNPRPTGLTIICVLGLVLASLGLLMSCLGGFGLAMQATGNDQMFFPRGGAIDAAALQQMQDELKVISRKWLPVTIALWIWQLGQTVLLFVACIAGLRVTPQARKWLLWAMIGGVLFELVRLWPTIAIQRETMGIASRMFDEIGGAGGRGMPPGLFEGIMSISIFIAVLMTLARLAYYGCGWWYAAREETLRYFGEAGGEPGEPLDDWDRSRTDERR